MTDDINDVIGRFSKGVLSRFSESALKMSVKKGGKQFVKKFSKTKILPTQDEALSYRVEVKATVMVTPIYSTPKRDAAECRHYDKDKDTCCFLGGKCKSRCTIDCIGFEPLNT